MYRSLQTCRAAAAILVVLFHLGPTLAADKYFGWPVLIRPFLFGHAGVDFFFVLSGFIIYYVHRQDIGHPGRLKTYLLKRAVRIYPIYWILFLVAFTAHLLVPSLPGTVPHDPLVVIKSMFLIPQDIRAVGGTGAPVLIVAWSLQYEVIFYLGFALLILNRALGAGVWIALLAAHFLLPKDVTYPFDFLQKDWLLFFLLGAGTAHLTDRLPKRIPPWLVAAAGGLVFFSAGISESLANKYDALLLRPVGFQYALASCLIIYGLVQMENRGAVIGDNPFWQLFGAASYTLYLIHIPIISVLSKISLLLGLHGHMGALIAYALIFIACLTAAALFHRLIEAPLLRWLSRWTKTKKDGQPLQEVRTT